MKIMSLYVTALISVFLIQSVIGYLHLSRPIHRKMILSKSKRMVKSDYMDHDAFMSKVDSTSAFKGKDTKEEMKLGVLLLNLGGPETMKDVEGFLYNLFADPDIIRLPPFLSFMQKPIAYVIAKRRAPKSSEAYRSIGGGSPIVKYTQMQSDLIAEKLREKGFKDAKCYFAMRYWNPYTQQVLDEVQKDGINTLVIVPLYPQYSISTSGSSLKLIQDIFYRDPHIWAADKVQHTVVPAWYYRKGYVNSVAKLMLKEINTLRAEDVAADGVDVLFSAHGVPQSYVVAGDPYQRQVEECIRLVSIEVTRLLKLQAINNDIDRLDTDALDAALPSDLVLKLVASNGGTIGGDESTGFDSTSSTAFIPITGSSTSNPMDVSTHKEHNSDRCELKFHLSYQSRVGPVQWIRPYTEETLKTLGDGGVKNLVVVPISFVSEHIETLEEIDIEYRELAEEHGVVNWRRSPALNTDELFMNDMANMVVDALESPSLMISEAVSMQISDIPTAVSAGVGVGGVPGTGLSGDAEVNVSRKGMFANAGETLNGRFAMLGFLGTTLLELFNGSPLVHMVGLR